jgi:FAD synthase
VEVHLLDHPGREPLRGKWLVTTLVKRLRGDQVFGSPEELVSAMDQDRARAAEYWSSGKETGGGG